MYTIVCTECHTAFSKDARICPKCGYLRRHVDAQMDAGAREAEPEVAGGESTWWHRTTYL